MSGTFRPGDPRLDEARFLDMGCGAGRGTADPRASGRIVAGADLPEAMLAAARTRYLASRRRAPALGGPHVAEMRDGAWPGRVRARTTDDGAPPVAPHSARHAPPRRGFEVLGLHDGPGPRPEPSWQERE
jgi:SAM-dependent methyltransferase